MIPRIVYDSGAYPERKIKSKIKWGTKYNPSAGFPVLKERFLPVLKERFLPVPEERSKQQNRIEPDHQS